MVKIWPTMAVLCVLVTILACGCIEEEIPTEVPEITIPPAASSTFTTPIPSQEEKNVEIVTGIVEEYYKTHTYSEYDLFVCGDMAIDVWNMVETEGINAQITVGNVDNPDADWTENNHAWVLVEVSPDTWLALETTGGYVTYDEKYYSGYFFKNPREFKEYLELKKEYNAQIDRINQLLAEVSDTYDELVKETDYCQELENEYNRRYAGRLLSPAEYQNSLSLQSRIYAQGIVLTRVTCKAEQLVYTIDEENKRLTEITNELIELLT